MIRDPESFEALRDGIARFVKERLVPFEKHVSERDEIPPELVEAETSARRGGHVRS